MRLIDADALNIRKYTRWFESVEDARQVERMIKEAPTIAPPPNDPLTLERLRCMKIEEWVWIEILEPSALRKTKSGYYRKHGDFTCDEAFCCGWPQAVLEYEDYGNTWLAYRHKPEDWVWKKWLSDIRGGDM